jgi:hypothetical protein
MVATVESDGHLGPVEEEGVASCTKKIDTHAFIGA